jgi:hypothetical protein
LYPHSGGGGFVAVGSTGFVGGSAAGFAIGNAIRTQNNFNDCMIATAVAGGGLIGWRLVEIGE